MTGLVPDVASMSLRGLLALHAATLTELVQREVLRTRNSPAGDLAERLTSVAYAGVLGPSSQKSWDVMTSNDVRIQVKCRLVVPGPRLVAVGLSPFRSFDFDSCVVLLLDQRDYGVVLALEIPGDVARERSRYVPHVNGYRLTVSEQLTAAPGVTDVTSRLAVALSSIDPTIQGETCTSPTH